MVCSKEENSVKCNDKRCQPFLDINKTDMLLLLQTKQKYKINHHLKCNDKCLTYLFSCKVCGIQYVGSITDRFWIRTNNDKENDKKP